MIDNRTDYLNLPLPHETNRLVDDVQRLSQSLVMLDGALEEGAHKLKNTIQINGVYFDGTSSITITAEAAGGHADTADAASSAVTASYADALSAPVMINGVPFDGTESINIAADAAKLASPVKINGVDFDGSEDITIEDDTKLPANGTASAAEKLASSVKINGVDFDGSADITIDTEDDTKLPLTGGRVTGTENATSTTTGAIQCDGGISCEKDIYAGGNVTAANVASPSDERLKDDIQSIEGALARVRQLRGVTYTDKATGTRRTGVIAQEVQQVLPEAVLKNGEYLAVSYGNLTGLLISAVNELADRLEVLTQKQKRGK